MIKKDIYLSNAIRESKAKILELQQKYHEDILKVNQEFAKKYKLILWYEEQIQK